jgi:hypothetical protein
MKTGLTSTTPDATTDELPDGDYDVQVEGRDLAIKPKDGKLSLRN